MVFSVKSLVWTGAILLCMEAGAARAASQAAPPPGAPASGSSESAPRPAWMAGSLGKIEEELSARYGPLQRARLHRGLHQVASFWRAEDGDAGQFAAFVRENYAGTAAVRDALFERLEALLEQLDGHMTEIVRHFRQQSELDRGPVLPMDELFAGYNPAAHIQEDFFHNRLAFVVLLNFPLTTLEERLQKGESWSRREWAEARLTARFAKRIPAEVYLEMTRAVARAESYIASYNIWMHHLLTADGKRLFPPGLFLLLHWNLRDEIKASYGDPVQGLAKQRTIRQVMERIIQQTIPAPVIDNPYLDWNPWSNQVRLSDVRDADLPVPPGLRAKADPEPDTRYARLREVFQAARRVDPFSPLTPTLMARRFEEDREIPESRVRAVLEQVLASPLLARTARLVEKRLQRPLEPFDIWYNGFRSRGRSSEAELDALVAQRYPSAEAFQKDIPSILEKLGFKPDKARWIAGHIAVDPARGSGHAMGAAMRTAQARLRTRVGKGGMNYKGYNIAVHELGHNVEQVLTLNGMDHTLLQGVPNTAFTEAFAFVFQSRDLELLGRKAPDPGEENLRIVNEYWNTCEIAAVSLVDMAIWHWMYEHPSATAAELKEAVVQIARDIWNRYYAPCFRVRDTPLLAIYSHIIQSYLYLPDYALGHLISFQIEERIRQAGVVGPEMERMTQAGNIAPDLWMKKAVGTAVGPQALLEAAEKAISALESTAPGKPF